MSCCSLENTIGLAITTMFDHDSRARRHILIMLYPLPSVKQGSVSWYRHSKFFLIPQRPKVAVEDCETVPFEIVMIMREFRDAFGVLGKALSTKRSVGLQDHKP